MGEKLGFLYALVNDQEQIIAGRVVSDDPVLWAIMLPGCSEETVYSSDSRSDAWDPTITILGIVPGFEETQQIREIQERCREAEKIVINTRLGLPDKAVPGMVREIFTAAWPDRIMDRTLFEEPLARALPRILELVEDHAVLDGTLRLSNLAYTLALYTEENQVLRCNLAWLARQDGLSRTVLRDLSRRIKYHQEATADMRVAEDGREENSAEYLRLQASVELACDMLDAVVASGLPEVGDPTQCDGQLPENWTARAANLVDVLRPYAKRQQSTTLHEIREYVR